MSATREGLRRSSHCPHPHSLSTDYPADCCNCLCSCIPCDCNDHGCCRSRACQQLNMTYCRSFSFTKKYPLLNLILVLPENQWAAGPAKVTIGLYLDWSTSRSLRGDCEEFCFRIFAENCKQRFCEAAEVFRAFLRGHLRPFYQKW